MKGKFETELIFFFSLKQSLMNQQEIFTYIPKKKIDIPVRIFHNDVDGLAKLTIERVD